VANLDELRLYSVLLMPHTPGISRACKLFTNNEQFQMRYQQNFQFTGNNNNNTQSVVVSTPSVPVANNSMETDSHDVPPAATNKNKSLTRIPKRKRGDTAEGDDVFEVVLALIFCVACRAFSYAHPHYMTLRFDEFRFLLMRPAVIPQHRFKSMVEIPVGRFPFSFNLYTNMTASDNQSNDNHRTKTLKI
jgi:hypothetical protein